LFDGWYTKKNGEGTKVPATISVSADTTYYAKWVAVPEGWEYNKDTGGMSKTFSYTGHIQDFTVLVEGSYTFELLGAAGGTGYYATYSGGVGGKSKGTITNLPKGRQLYVYVGGKGGDGTSSAAGAGDWNGGGNGTYKTRGGGGGGGATDIRFDQGSLNTRVIVAGGGGGSSIYGYGYGGGASGNKGGSGGGSAGSGGGSSGGGAGGKGVSDNGVSGSFGSGGAGISDGFGGSGGGGGYYGGGGGAGGDAGGGSGFVYGFNETQGNQSSTTTAIPEGYKSYKFTSDWECKVGEGSSGDGSATVTYTP
jgi:uncharacterized repeat protein (TIGR02543 family)